MPTLISRQLKDLRGESTQQEVADAIEGLTRERLSHYETGRSEPDLATCVKFADYFQVSMDDLLGRRYPNDGGEAPSLRRVEDYSLETLRTRIQQSRFTLGEQPLTKKQASALLAVIDLILEND